MMKKWEDKLHDQEEDSSIPIKPQRVMHALRQVAHDDAILSVDVGNVTVWTARHFRMTNQQFIISSWLATLGAVYLVHLLEKLLSRINKYLQFVVMVDLE